MIRRLTLIVAGVITVGWIICLIYVLTASLGAML
jgi:hypothetical protein